MPGFWPAVVVSDLDGTLLGSRDYSFEEARPALAALREKGIPVVFVSSKTRAETEFLREAMGIDHPFVVENGGAAYLPIGYFKETVGLKDSSGRYEVLSWGRPYEDVVAALRKARDEAGAKFMGFSDVDEEEIARRTGLALDDARRAMERQYDEPFWLEGVEGERSRKALSILAAENLTVTRGGRFYHVMGDCDKGWAVREILGLYRRFRGSFVSVGLGDASNDIPLLREVDRAYVMAGSDGRHDPAVKMAVARARAVGPAPGGWSEAIDDFLKSLDF